MQRSALLVAVRVDVGATILDKNSSTLEVTVVSGMMQCCPPILSLIHICKNPETKLGFKRKLDLNFKHLL